MAVRGPGNRSLWLLASAVFVVALALRLGHLLSLRSAWEGTQLFSLARGDAAYHWREAQTIMDRSFLLRDAMPWKAPGYSYFLAALMSVFGREPATLRWIMAFLGALNCAGLVVLARRVLPVGWAALVGLLAAGNGVLILFDGELFFPTLLVTLTLLTLLVVSRPAAGIAGHAGAGALMGLATLVHPPYGLAVVAWAVWIQGRHRARALALVGAAVLTVAPVSLQNHFLRNESVLLSASGGVNLYVGNQPCFDQRSGQQISTVTWSRLLETPRESGLTSAAERDRLYYGLTARQAIRAPFTALRLAAEKALLLLNPVELGNNIRLYETREASAVLRATMGPWGPFWLPFAAWAPLALWGVVLVVVRKRFRTSPLHGLLLLWGAAIAVSIVLSFNTARYRAPLVFFGTLWVAAALRWLWRSWRDGRWWRVGVAAGGMAAFALISSLLAAEQTALPPPAAWSQAQVDEAEGRPQRAERRLLGALRATPEDALLMMEVAAFYGRAGRPDREREWYHRLLELNDLDPDLRSHAYEQIARSHLRQGSLDAARVEVERALAVDADRATYRGFPHYDLGLDPLTACRLRLLLAEIEVRAGNRPRAREALERVAADCPGSRSLRGPLQELQRRAAHR